MTVIKLSDDALAYIAEIKRSWAPYDISTNVIIEVALKSFADTLRESTLLDVLDDSHET